MTQCGENSLSSQRCWAIGLSTHGRMKLDPYLLPHREMNGSTNDQNLRDESVRLLGESRKKSFFFFFLTERNLHDLGLSSDFLALTSKVPMARGRSRKTGLDQIENFLLQMMLPSL